MKHKNPAGKTIALLILLVGCTTSHRTNMVGLDVQKQLHKPITSWQELKEKNVAMQDLDYSCGAASLSTLMLYYFEDDLTEEDILDEILEDLTDEELDILEDEGLSFLHLAEVAERFGYTPTGLAWISSKEKRNVLPKLPPMIVHLERDEYQHFAILRGVVEDRVYLADPSRGNIRVPMYSFLTEWSGKVLYLEDVQSTQPTDYPLKVSEEVPIRHELQSVRRAIFPSP
jgi:predicted double-glycine peptidase